MNTCAIRGSTASGIKLQVVVFVAHRLARPVQSPEAHAAPLHLHRDQPRTGSLDGISPQVYVRTRRRCAAVAVLASRPRPPDRSRARAGSRQMRYLFHRSPTPTDRIPCAAVPPAAARVSRRTRASATRAASASGAGWLVTSHEWESASATSELLYCCPMRRGERTWLLGDETSDGFAAASCQVPAS